MPPNTTSHEANQLGARARSHAPEAKSRPHAHYSAFAMTQMKWCFDAE